jgi:hypothetical protein
MFSLKLHNVTNDQPLLPPYVLYRDELNLNGTTNISFTLGFIQLE